MAKLQADVGPAHYARRDIPLRSTMGRDDVVARLTDEAPGSLAGEKVVEVGTLDGVRYLLADESWLLIRPSGTEPVLRVYAEARDPTTVDVLLGYGEQVAGG